jgi:hypothetical protein
MHATRQQSMRSVSNERIMKNLFFFYCTFYCSRLIPNLNFVVHAKILVPFRVNTKGKEKVEYESLR